jgi:hypothetical protein
MQNRHCVVLVDGAWNTETARFRPSFKEFASWCQTKTDVQVLTMMINPKDTSDDVWKLCHELWNKYDIDSGGLKTFGGDGRVLWINNGEVVDFAWCMEFMHESDTADTAALLRTRTSKAFD